MNLILNDILEQEICTPFYYDAIGTYGIIMGQTNDDIMVIILSEIPENEGPSITNAVQHLLYHVSRTFALDSDYCVFIEHYENMDHYNIIKHDEHFNFKGWDSLGCDGEDKFEVLQKIKPLINTD